MSKEPSSLSQLSAKTVARPTGVGTLPRGIHRIAGVREWVTLESAALPPVPVKRDETWQIICLLALPVKLSDRSKGWLAPWGAIIWDWPSKQVAAKIDLRQDPQIILLRRQQNTIRAFSGDVKTRTKLENCLFAALDKLLETPANSALNFSELAKHYAQLLPIEIYDYYWHLIPETKSWLLPPETPSVLPKEIDVKSWENPKDLSKHIGVWMQKSEDLARASGLSEMLGQVENLASTWHLPGFRLAVVGEINRGKSTFINRLLGEDVVPVGFLPTTATVISLIPGPENKMIVKFPQGGPETRSLTAASWEDLLATNEMGNEQSVYAGVQLTLEHQWLRSLDVELIDTPGCSDLNQHRIAQIFDLLSRCDAAIILIHANVPVSLTETLFLEQELRGRHIQRMLVAVSHLDSIASTAERQRVFDYIQDKISKIAPDIPVLPLSPLGENTVAPEDLLETARQQIENMVSHSTRRAWRSQQIAGKLADYLVNLQQLGEIAITAARSNPEERQKAIESAAIMAKKSQEKWGQIRQELDRRRLATAQDLREKILNVKTDLIDSLKLELEQTQNLKFWWEKKLPYRLQRELPKIASQLEEQLIKRIARDFQGLQQYVSSTFNLRLNQPNLASTISKSEPVKVQFQSSEKLELENLQRYRLLTRIGGSAATIGSYVFGAPIGVITNLGITVLSEKFLNATLEEQRTIIVRELLGVIDEYLDKYCQSISQRLQKLYQQLMEDVKQQQVIWESSQKAVVSVSKTEQQWQELIAKSQELHREIKSELKL